MYPEVFPNRDATEDELYACTGGMSVASKVTLRRDVLPRVRPSFPVAGAAVAFVRGVFSPKAAGADAAGGGKCGPNGCTF